jgi:hypothetical protein
MGAADAMCRCSFGSETSARIAAYDRRSGSLLIHKRIFLMMRGAHPIGASSDTSKETSP